ncbi:MAG: 5'-methylthioadenosine/adenosylhomocysteine nucleosidase [Coriobacteriales bacterium]|nr:5'-methylthioadenosine/adenosylhomocysteine nucleosidase [Coriobacteriales bacterium]
MQEPLVIGIIGAMEEEVEHLKCELENEHVVCHAGMELYTGTLGGVRVAVAQCGIGKVNAALCAQALHMCCGATCIVNTGVAGSLDARINIGDIVVSTDAVEHDFDVSALGYEPGVIPDMDVSVFVADERMRAAALEAVAAMASDVQVFEGRVASGDQFIASEEQKERIVSTFGALCCEMEGASIAHACHAMGVPFVVIRAISDKADGSAHMDYPMFEVKAADHCARIVEHMVRTLSEDAE